MKIQAALFKNQYKRGDRDPDYRGNGELRLDDNTDLEVKVELAGWAKTAKSGKQYLSLSMRWEGEAQAPKAPPPQQESQQQQETIPDSLKKDAVDDDLPF